MQYLTAKCDRSNFYGLNFAKIKLRGALYKVVRLKMSSIWSYISRMNFRAVLAIFILYSGFGMSQTPSNDALALLEFRKAIHKDPSGYVLNSWKEKSMDNNGCPMAWHGVICNNGMITGVNLANLNLSGEIKLGIFTKLTMLQILSLSNNSFTGKLSTELGTSHSIQYMDLSENLFYGTIPVEIGGLQNLLNLSLAGNKLTGIIPDSISGMSSVQYLDFSRNSLSGRVPSTLTNLQHLVFLNLSSNRLSGEIPAGLEKLQDLKNLDLHRNKLAGPIDQALIFLACVQYIDFSDNMLSGPLPWKMPIISSLTESLQYLNLSNNQLTGPLVSGNTIPVFESLKVLDVSSNLLTGELPAFRFVYALEILRLSNNRFSGFIPFELLAQDSSVLIELDLSWNNLSGPLGTIMSTTLKILNVSSNSLSGTLPISMGSCAVVDLSNNKFSGNLSVLQTWGNAMEVLDLSCNQFTGALPNDTSQFLRLKYLNLSHNNLKGPLPSILGTYPKLNVVDLSFNQLNGSLLTSLFASSTLAHLHLSNNRFTGIIPLQDIVPVIPASLSVPSPLTQYSRLESLNLSSNKLNGSVPREMGLIGSLRALDLSKNNFSGSIPSELHKLFTLVDLDLSVNHLTGHIPDNLPNSLQAFNASYNDLSGIVPQNLRRFPDSSFHPGNAGLLFPHFASSSNRGPTVGSKEIHGKGFNAGLKAAVIGGCTAVAALLIVLALILHYRRVSNSQELIKHPEFDTKFTGADVNKGSTSSASHLGVCKDVEPVPAVSLSFSADDLIRSEKELPVARVKGFTTDPALQWPPDVKIEGLDSAKISGAAISPPKNKRSSPGCNSHFSSSPQSGESSTPEHPIILKVRSPDRLAGDLYFLDDTLALTAEELSRAPAEVLGRSSHGTSYKATLDNGHLLTVKWLREGLAKHKKDFAREAKKFGSIRHPNVISLRGYYWGPSEHEKLILSDYVSPGSLASHMNERSGRNISPLSWNQRLKIALDIARGLNYLHYERCLPHGNLKATNVLLDGPDLNGRLSDYSLHRLMTHAGTAEQILNAGVLGYRAPELASAKKPRPSCKADIYAFGVLLLEILTGKSAGDIISGNMGAVDLTDWVRLLAMEGRGAECFDPALLGMDGDQELPKGMHDMLSIALKCIHPVSERPNMKSVYEDLSSILA
eukprot:Gb_30406 [translate_table: standard]